MQKERTEMSRTAVVILTWNGLSHLKEFLPGVMEHTPGEDAEIWVADNASTDGTIGWLEKNHPSVRRLSFPENLGYAGGYARALSVIEARYFVLLNSDIEVGANWLRPLVKHMDANLETAACQPKILSWKRKSHFEYAGAAGGFIDSYGYPFCRGRILDKLEADEGQYDSVMPVFWASGACMMLRASAYHAAGGLDPDFFAHMEEIDLCWRLNNMGFRIDAVPDSAVYHVGGASLSYDSPFKVYLNFRNSLFMLRKNLPDGQLHTVLFIRKVLDAVAAAVYLFRLRPSLSLAVFRAHMHYYRSGSRLRSKRQEVQSKAGVAAVPDNIMLRRSILFLYYFRRIRKFSEISFNKFR